MGDVLIQWRAMPPPPNGAWYWSCAECGANIGRLHEKVCGCKIEHLPCPAHGMAIIPESKYWHGHTRVPYCSPECSLEGHKRG